MTVSATSRARAQAFVAELNARTHCAHCGAQPIEWHNPEHVELNRKGYRISGMAASGASIHRIERELARCTPLCRRCHMAEDGRLAKLIERVTAPRPPVDPKPCVDCSTPYKPLRRGRCMKCDCRHRYYQMTKSGELRGVVSKRAWRSSTCGDLGERVKRLEASRAS